MAQGEDIRATKNEGALNRLAQVVTAIVGFSVARVRAILVVTLLLSAGCLIYTINRFDIRTDMDSLLSADLPWRKEIDRLKAAFPTESEDIIIVIDGQTPELADQAAARLMETLSPQSAHFAGVERLNGGAFFDQHGLLFLQPDELQETLDGLIGAQPLLGPLAADPSIRGLMLGLQTAAASTPDDAPEARRLGKAMAAISQTIADERLGERRYFSWRSLLSDGMQKPREWRQYIQINPKLDYTSTMPGERASAAVHAAVRALKLDAAHGVGVQVTGSVPIADEELGTLEESVGPIAIVMFALMTGILYAAVRSTRIVLSILITVLAGAIITSAIGLFLLGRFNLISIAFMPLFIGLGMDFAVQYCVRARADRAEASDLAAAQRNAAFGIGGGLALAAAATAAGFLAFLPTSYRGVAELGLIAGIGMMIAFLMTITTLPALICAIGVEKSAADKGLRFLKNADAIVMRNRLRILIAGGVLGIIFAALLPRLQFDFDPMRLRSPKTESMAAYLDLAQSADTTPNTVSVLSANIDESKALAKRLLKLPQVGDVLGIHTYIPDRQDEKLPMIYDARMLLEFSLQPFETAAPPVDEDVISSLKLTADSLRGSFSMRSGPLADSGRALAAQLEALALAPAVVRHKTTEALMQGFPVALAQINALLTAERITLETLPTPIKQSWLTPDGKARIEVAPARPLRTVRETQEFVSAVRSIAPKAAGDAIAIVESGKTILGAFAMAGALSAIIIIILLWLAFSRGSWTALTLAPVLLSSIFTFGSCAALGLVINLENLIALPLILGIGVAFNIYFVVAWRNGARDLLQSSLARGVLYSALTTGASFGALGLSAHPGTASMGALLGLSLAWIVLTTLVISPALLSVCAGKTISDESAAN